MHPVSDMKRLCRSAIPGPGQPAGILAGFHDLPVSVATSVICHPKWNNRQVLFEPACRLSLPSQRRVLHGRVDDSNRTAGVRGVRVHSAMHVGAALSTGGRCPKERPPSSACARTALRVLRVRRGTLVRDSSGARPGRAAERLPSVPARGRPRCARHAHLAVALLSVRRRAASVPSRPAIIIAPPNVDLGGALDGLDARDALPPLLQPGMLMDLEGYAAWESRALDLLARGDVNASQAIATIAAATRALEGWGSMTSRARASIAIQLRRRRPDEDLRRNCDRVELARSSVPRGLRRATVAHDVSSTRTASRLLDDFDHVVRNYLAARLFGNWIAYHGRGLQAVVEYVRVCSRRAEDGGRPAFRLLVGVNAMAERHRTGRSKHRPPARPPGGRKGARSTSVPEPAMTTSALERFLRYVDDQHPRRRRRPRHVRARPGQLTLLRMLVNEATSWASPT